MSSSFLVPCFMVLGLTPPAPVSRLAEKPAKLSVSYTHAGLTEITIKDGKLRYVQYTPRKYDDRSTGPANLDAYDRHQIDVWLTRKEAERFRRWVSRHQVFGFDEDYPSAGRGSGRAAAFKSSLIVVQGDKKHHVSWVGDSKTPKRLDAAIIELTTLADEIRKSRSK